MSESNENPAREPPGKERRASVRHACTIENFSTKVSTGSKTETEQWPVTVLDISTTGVALLLRRPFEPGTVLTLAFRDDHFKVEQTLQIRVAHLKARSRSEWLAGCSFERALSENELRALL